MPSVIFTYDNGRKALQERLGDKLAKEGLPAQLLMYAWVTSTERDYSYLSQIKQYKPFIEIMRHSFTRLLYQAGAKDAASLCTPDDMEYILAEYKQLKPREGLAEMMDLLRTSGFEVWCCTDANQDRVKGYFDSAGIDMPLERILSADEIRAGKPEAAVYQWAMGKASSLRPGEKNIFAASHAWDVAAARSAGFEIAYCTAYEYDPCEAIYGAMDIIEPDLASLGKAIVAKYGAAK
ncbi:haloacid dehalogenase [Acaromyces ingoldii]|uniref:Haloacid dehalogenase n=1 Tax=Acaromyces ingoldii TaxID=215250 RepID=A0A316YC93_9BASI|nr:haloacid dehalogenase [Acaromyces ingoldii]PWN86892.1 haloacid dehalogenase [Acaromyces ingoldii]